MPDYYERVARVMADSISVGPYAEYDTILTRLRKQFPDPVLLDRHVVRLFEELEAIAGFKAPDGVFPRLRDTLGVSELPDHEP